MGEKVTLNTGRVVELGDYEKAKSDGKYHWILTKRHRLFYAKCDVVGHWHHKNECLLTSAIHVLGVLKED